jgi:hypothetical protein
MLVLEQFASSELPDSYREARAVTVDKEVATNSRPLLTLSDSGHCKKIPNQSDSK